MDGLAFEGGGQFKFALLDGGGQSVWSQDGTSVSGSEPSGHVTLQIRRGIYTAPLGDDGVNGMAALSAGICDSDSLSLRVWFNDGSAGFQQLTPDRPLGSVAFAIRAESAARADSAAMVDDVPVHDASKVASEVFDAARIPNLDVAKISTGMLDPVRIPNLDAAKITAGIDSQFIQRRYVVRSEDLDDDRGPRHGTDIQWRQIPLLRSGRAVVGTQILPR